MTKQFMLFVMFFIFAFSCFSQETAETRKVVVLNGGLSSSVKAAGENPMLFTELEYEDGTTVQVTEAYSFQAGDKLYLPSSAVVDMKKVSVWYKAEHNLLANPIGEPAYERQAEKLQQVSLPVVAKVSAPATKKIAPVKVAEVKKTVVAVATKLVNIPVVTVPAKPVKNEVPVFAVVDPKEVLVASKSTRKWEELFVAWGLATPTTKLVFSPEHEKAGMEGFMACQGSPSDFGCQAILTDVRIPGPMNYARFKVLCGSLLGFLLIIFAGVWAAKRSYSNSKGKSKTRKGNRTLRRFKCHIREGMADISSLIVALKKRFSFQPVSLSLIDKATPAISLVPLLNAEPGFLKQLRESLSKEIKVEVQDRAVNWIFNEPFTETDKLRRKILLESKGKVIRVHYLNGGKKVRILLTADAYAA